MINQKCAIEDKYLLKNQGQLFVVKGIWIFAASFKWNNTTTTALNDESPYCSKEYNEFRIFREIKKVSNVNLSNACLMDWTKNVAMLKAESQNLKEI